MSTAEPTDDTALLAEVAMLAQRAGLKLSAAELAGLTQPYQRARTALAGLRAALAPTEEPSNTFDAIGQRTLDSNSQAG